MLVIMHDYTVGANGEIRDFWVINWISEMSLMDIKARIRLIKKKLISSSGIEPATYLILKNRRNLMRSWGHLAACVSACVSSFLLLGNAPVNTFPRQRMHMFEASFSMRSVWYRRKVGVQFFPELLAELYFKFAAEKWVEGCVRVCVRACEDGIRCWR